MLIEVKNKQARASFLLEAGGLLTDLCLQGPAGEVFSILRADPAKYLQKLDLINLNNIANWPTFGSPLLFPFAGRVWHQEQVGKYFWLGREWEMPIHGLAYLRPWKIRQQEDHAITLYLEDDHKTQNLFPYRFLLEARYELHESALHLSIKVENRGLLKEVSHFQESKKTVKVDSSMPVNLGLHPFFQIRAMIANHNQGYNHSRNPSRNQNCDSKSPVDNQTASEYKLQLASGVEQSIKWHRVTGGRCGLVLTGAELKAKLSTNFPRDEDAIIMCAGSELGLEILRKDRDQEPYLLCISADTKFSTWVLHSRLEDDFVCIEPWYGPPNNIETKNGLQLLPAGASLESTFSISLNKKHRTP
ncbi:MAG: hypothetical protein KBD78_04965 [Oligoflexales bacterium]|nr:hypothetical protein [Oligoflexales bacterium]